MSDHMHGVVPALFVELMEAWQVPVINGERSAAQSGISTRGDGCHDQQKKNERDA
jgi:hypothetical protein